MITQKPSKKISYERVKKVNSFDSSTDVLVYLICILFAAIVNTTQSRNTNINM